MLLSICIPTYNRVEYLQKTLDSIVNQEGFATQCEIVICDNNSSDNTAEIVKKYVEKYDNIRYYRHNTNIGPDKNFISVMDFARGKYIKLHGDKVGFCDMGITKLIRYLENIDVSVTFLLNGQTNLQENNMTYCNTFDEFVQIVSYWSTWMSGIILRNSDYNNLQDKERAMGSCLIQTDIMFEIILKKPTTLVINERLIFEQPIDNKGGYNLFEVFLNNYLGLYDEYLAKGVLCKETLKNEKIKLLLNFIFPWYTESIIMKKNHFEIKNSNKIIIKHYKNYPQLLLYPIYCLKYYSKCFYRWFI